MTAPASAPATPTRARRLPAEWWFAAGFAVIGLWVSLRTPLHWSAVDEQLYRMLAAAFFAGFVIMIGVAHGHALLNAVAPARRRLWRQIAGNLAVALTLALYIFVKAPRTLIITRLLEASALGAALAAGALTLVLPLVRVVRWRDAIAAFLQTLRLWGSLLVFSAFGGFCLAATRLYTPLVWDPVLLRMDLSLGFNPSGIAWAWRYNLPWVYPLSNTAYTLLGLMIVGVIARLQIAGVLAQARRALLASFLVGVLGLGCYQLMPAIGPVYAFPGAYPALDSSAREAAAATALAPALAGPRQMPGGRDFTRNVMPSLHAAFALVALAAAWSWRRRFFWQCLPLGFLQIATTLILAVHYFVDLLAAVPLAVLCWWIADRAVRATPQAAEDDPLPALAVSGQECAARTRWLGLTLAASVGGLLLWAWLAPLPPWIAWPLAAFVVAAPLQASLRLNRQEASAAAPAVAARRPWPLRLLAGAVFCTGGIALVLEQIYEKYLSTLVGSSRSAATIVLAVYCTGLALGAWWCPKKSAGAPRRLALLELFLAAWAVVVGLFFFPLDGALGNWLAATGNSAFTLAAARLVLAVGWILPPTFAMGAQLPTLAAVLAGHAQWRGETISRYYTLNLAGAFVFTVATPPLLFCTVGADGALWFIAALGTIVGLALWFGLPASEWHGHPARVPNDAGRMPAPLNSAALALAFAAGFVFFALEVVWFHLISAVCGASTFSFSLLLAIVLLGLALGGRAARKLPASLPLALGPTLAWLLVALALGSACWPAAGPFMAREQAGQQFEWFWSGEMIKGIVVAFIVLPTAALAGRIFPLLLRNVEQQTETARAVGALCALNVVGCIAGALLTGFVLIPQLGAEHALLILAGAVAAGWLGLQLCRPGQWSTLLPGIAGLILLVMLPRWNRLELTSGYGVYLQPELAPGSRLEFFREDFSSGFVTVVSVPSATRVAPVKTLLQNGKFDANDAAEMPAQLGFGLVAALHAPAQNHALIIGCGSGQTAGLIARLGFAHVDLAELSPAHLAAARAEFTDLNAGVLNRANVAVHIEDGRNFLLRTSARYDLIQIELTSVWFAGATNLYSREFCALARAHLAPGGVLVQWIQLHHITPREIASILATAHAEFPSVSVWNVGGQACLLASDSEPRLNPAVWQQWRSSSQFFDELLLTGYTTPTAFAAAELVSAEKLRALLAHTDVTLNTDRNRWLEFQTPRYYLSTRDHRAENLRWLTASP